MNNVILEVEAERSRQVFKGYTSEHDDEHTLAEFAAFINWRAGMIEQDSGSFADQRKWFIQIAALSVAAAEALDRTAEKAFG